MKPLEVDVLLHVLDCMLYSLRQAHDSEINVIFKVDTDQQAKNQVYYIIDGMYKLMEAAGVKPEHYNAILNECRWYSKDSDWQEYCDYAGYKLK